MMNSDKALLKTPQFITVEGGEGAGKSSLIRNLEVALRGKGKDVVTTREPGGTSLGEQVRSWLLANEAKVSISAQAELFLFLAARSQHIEDVIMPALNAGKVVICDRFNDSTVAYQGAGRNLGVEWVRTLCNITCGKPVPDLTFYLDVDPSVGLQRTRKLDKDTALGGELDRIESEKHDFHERVRAAFIGFAEEEPHRFCCLDANQPQENVIAAALRYLEARF